MQIEFQTSKVENDEDHVNEKVDDSVESSITQENETLEKYRNLTDSPTLQVVYIDPSDAGLPNQKSCKTSQ